MASLASPEAARVNGQTIVVNAVSKPLHSSAKGLQAGCLTFGAPRVLLSDLAVDSQLLRISDKVIPARREPRAGYICNFI